MVERAVLPQVVARTHVAQTPGGSLPVRLAFVAAGIFEEGLDGLAANLALEVAVGPVRRVQGPLGSQLPHGFAEGVEGCGGSYLAEAVVELDGGLIPLAPDLFQDLLRVRLAQSGERKEQPDEQP